MAFTANTVLQNFFVKKIQKYFWKLLFSSLLEKNTFVRTWKTLSVKLLKKLMNFLYQILELELESLFNPYLQKSNTLASLGFNR